jgi:hypothetical protein
MADVIAYALKKSERQAVDSYEALLDTDRRARALASEYIARK